MDALQKLYESEIKFSITTFWDDAFQWGLGDGMNGFCATGTSRTFSDAVAALSQAAKEHFPGSAFAQAA
jgi:hypothetical protein